jgi:surfeit locus 1 family protein
MAAARRRFRPTFWATLWAGLGVALLLGLAVWQLQRLEWKEALIAERNERPQLPALAAEELLAIEDAEPFEYRLARVTGEYRHEAEMHLVARSLNGNVGVQVVTPFALENGPTILVNRGWVPDDHLDPATRAEGQPSGAVTIEALVRRPGEPNWLVPDNEPAANRWFWMDLPAMRAAADLSPAGPPLYLEERAGQHPGEFPIGGQSRLELPNDHLQYAITWFLLAIALAVIWFLYHWRREENGEKRP